RKKHRRLRRQFAVAAHHPSPLISEEFSARTGDAKAKAYARPALRRPSGPGPCERYVGCDNASTRAATPRAGRNRPFRFPAGNGKFRRSGTSIVTMKLTFSSERLRARFSVASKAEKVHRANLAAVRVRR